MYIYIHIYIYTRIVFFIACTTLPRNFPSAMLPHPSARAATHTHTHPLRTPRRLPKTNDKKKAFTWRFHRPNRGSGYSRNLDLGIIFFWTRGPYVVVMFSIHWLSWATDLTECEAANHVKVWDSCRKYTLLVSPQTGRSPVLLRTSVFLFWQPNGISDWDKLSDYPPITKSKMRWNMTKETWGHYKVVPQFVS